MARQAARTGRVTARTGRVTARAGRVTGSRSGRQPAGIRRA
ncbi:hypothetical protein [Plantactinospora sp. GCM10030261]